MKKKRNKEKKSTNLYCIVLVASAGNYGEVAQGLHGEQLPGQNLPDPVRVGVVLLRHVHLGVKTKYRPGRKSVLSVPFGFGKKQIRIKNLLFIIFLLFNIPIF